MSKSTNLGQFFTTYDYHYNRKYRNKSKKDRGNIKKKITLRIEFGWIEFPLMTVCSIPASSIVHFYSKIQQFIFGFRSHIFFFLSVSCRCEGWVVFFFFFVWNQFHSSKKFIINASLVKYHEIKIVYVYFPIKCKKKKKRTQMKTCELSIWKKKINLWWLHLKLVAVTV